MSAPALTWLGDDFTGSAAVMEVLAFAGVPARLFLDIPEPDELKAAVREVRAIGIASTLRAEPPAAFPAIIGPALDALLPLGAPLFHYKVCSTMDSSPLIGSIGAAMDLVLSRLDSPFVPVLFAAPQIRRYQAFGTLFAAAGRDVHRLDRHPVMARHPVTPMAEADVRRHLGAQTARPIGLIDVERLGDPPPLDGVMALDTVTDAHLAQAGGLIARNEARFAVGSQGVEYALTAHWRRTGMLPAQPADPPAVAPVERIAAVAGSVSPTTAEQIARAERAGFVAIRHRPGDDPAIAAAAAVVAAQEGRCPLVYTARGPDDPAVQADADRAAIGAALGEILDRVLAQTGVARAAVAGGDTSGAVARALGLRSLDALARITDGAALCRARRAAGAPLEIVLKGGQMGGPDFFAEARGDGMKGMAA